jgi:hypothetical protein
MYYRKPNVLISFICVTAMAVSFSAWADSADDGAGTYFRGPMATCLSKAKVVFPCVSLSPPAYQANTAFVTTAPLETDLPLGTDKHKHRDSWLDRLMDGAWNPTALFADNLQGMDMNFSVDRSGTGMKMNLGPMKLNMYVDENHFSESQFILGVDRTW